MGMLELGKTRRQKFIIVVVMTILHLLAVIGIIATFVVVGSPALPPVAAAFMVLCTVTWLLTFILVAINITYLYLKRD